MQIIVIGGGPGGYVAAIRAAQLGVSIADLDLLTIGMLQDMYIEAINDGASYARVATQEDFDRF